MSKENITLKVDAEAARAFKASSVAEQEKIEALLGVWLKEYARADRLSLKETMDEISRNAQSRGLTPEILKSILEEE